MIPTVEQVFNLARYHLGDTSTSGGQLFTDTFLFNYWPNAYDSLFRWLDRNSNKLLRVSKYYNLPANTGYLTPASMGIPNLGRVDTIRDRAIATTITGTIVFFTPSSLGVPPSVNITAMNHGYSSGAEVLAFGFPNANVSDDINDSWYINVIDANTIQLLGCAAVNISSGVGASGIITTGSGEFSDEPLTQDYDEDAFPLSAVNGQLSVWKWMGGAFRFIPANVARQIKVTFMLSGTAPTVTTTSIGIDDSLDALAFYLAGAAAAAKGFPQKSQSLFMRAVGNPSGETTHISGGAFYELAQLGLQTLQMTRVVLPRYRRKRNCGPTAYSW
jgi:hypothetical protein